MTNAGEWREVERQLADAVNYWVCTVRADLRPHAAPVWGVWWRGTLAFSSVGVSVKVRNLRRDDRVTAHLESASDVVILDGHAVEITERDALVEIGESFTAKYGASTGGAYDLVAAHRMGMAVCAVRPTVVRSWRAGAALASSRWTFDDDGGVLLSRSSVAAEADAAG
ncbi:pyridoxamine 5'-phosphate oxidase family protein [Micromonospora sp. WMMD882]|uniref:pyridoxamine 5'-phosphate oxidase family protein n=1 Tax=Micromonospora sp. WMMD882 TaxID=3015151 RepID=UPI00248C92E6|nr:pyridoxamine 5'-phosphate oxidase family protein [Micromonospora sp. WMMD882]WBB77301.1 pyridoxamine 5'-phosphate oxidase family protein [Micromonospora sp. WMMD882]